MKHQKKTALIILVAIIAMSMIWGTIYNLSNNEIVDSDVFFEGKHLETEKKLNTYLDYENFIKGDNVISHEIENGDKIVRWKDGDRTSVYIANKNNTLLMILSLTYFKDMPSCVTAYEKNKTLAQKIYKTRAKNTGLDNSSVLLKDQKEIMLYCAKNGDEYVNMVTYRYIQ